MIKNFLITGPPGVGKTTIIRNFYEILKKEYPKVQVIGFYTSEVRKNGVRTGFQIIPLDEKIKGGVLASTDIVSQYHVGKYNVDLKSLEEIIKSLQKIQTQQPQIYLIDEIGKMECYSKIFVDWMTSLLNDKDKIIISTIGEKGIGFMEQVKKRNDISITIVNPSNRDVVPKMLLEKVSVFKEK